ncbi:3-oxoacyl-ACP reductase FabG [Microbulbifer sp. S227A]|uniref:3-oxoacyl-ACP reductase FabG n=1 Tax=Microbulbifer sp. S227A TaxID=3415131 RepID=UPI003C798789
MSRTILVTGASKGIGRAIAIRLAQDGFDILVHYAGDESGAKETLEHVQAAGRKGWLVQFDVSHRDDCARAIQAHLATNGHCYGAVLNAGVTCDKAFPAMQGNEWDGVLRTNLDGFYNVLHPLLMPMIGAREGGRIVVMSSVSGLMGNRGQTNYSASKAGLIGAAKSLAVELAKRRITVNSVAPGLIDTKMAEDLPVEDIKRAIPMRRLGRPEEVAAVVSFLCSPEAEYVTRQVISVNGGMQ